MKKAITTSLTVISSLYVALAQFTPPVNTNSGVINETPIKQFLTLVQNIINALVPIFIGVAVLSFFWFLIQFIAKGGEEGEKRANALKGMGLSILALFAMVSIWGIVFFLGSIVGITPGGRVPYPQVQ
jgi:hypothetical protein